MNNLASLPQDLGDLAGAEPLLRAVAEARAARLPPGHWLRAYSDVMLGRALRATGREAEAHPMIESGYRALSAALPRDGERVRAAAALSVR